MHDVRASNGLPGGVRSLASLRPEDADALGEEAAARVAAVIEPVLTPGREVRLEPWFTSRSATLRAKSRWPVLAPITSAAEITARVRELLDAVRAPAMVGALAGSLGSLRLRVVAAGGVSGSAASVDPKGGDPDHLAVWAPGALEWLVDRRTMRVERSGEGAVDEALAARASDLVDRAQLVLGKPVEIDWSSPSGRPLVHAVRTMRVDPSFTAARAFVAVLSRSLSISPPDLSDGRRRIPRACLSTLGRPRVRHPNS